MDVDCVQYICGRNSDYSQLNMLTQATVRWAVAALILGVVVSLESNDQAGITAAVNCSISWSNSLSATCLPKEDVTISLAELSKVVARGTASKVQTETRFWASRLQGTTVSHVSY